MGAYVPILLVIFGAITAWRVLSMRHEERMERLRQGKDPDQQALLSAHAKQLEERVRHLETIVCSVDFELNAKLNRLATVQLQLGDATSKMLAAGSIGGGEGGGASAPTKAALFSLEPGQRLADRFVVERALGQGGMGAVYLARDEQLGERVALKIMHGLALLDPSAGERLRREASAARRISHPQVVKIHDLGEDQGHLFLSMEYVEGQSLAELIRRHGTLPTERVRDVVRQICAGLSAAHAKGVIHRDLKPANVLLTPDQQVKIIDFGLARVTNLEGMTATGMLLGTPEYMAPEQIKGGSVDARTDLYSLGALIYHAITGRPPFTGDTPIAVSLAQATEDPPAPSQLRPDLDTEWDVFVLKALSKQRDDRFESASAMAEALP